MTPEQIEKLFKPFKQADASISRRFGGSGLGLSLSKRLAELLHCELSVTSEPGTGSVFTLHIPNVTSNCDAPKFIHSVDEIKNIQQDEQSPAPQAKLSGTILLAEDNLMNQQLIQRLLEKMGTSVMLAENGEVAVKLALQQHFDLIFMDMQMPMMSGLDAVKVLRERNYPGPIVMLTANVTLEDRNLCSQAGSNDFLTKPINREKMYQITKKYLEKTKN